MHSAEKYWRAGEENQTCVLNVGNWARPNFDKVVRVDRRDITASAGVDEREIDANGFGAALLMPRKMLISEIESLIDSPKSSFDAESLIGQLAERFDVSHQAMKYRLANLGIAMLSE